MRIEQWGGLEVRVVGGEDREGGGSGPAVVLLHGFGAPGDDLVGLWRVMRLPASWRFVFPAAPLSLTAGFGDSRAWWHIDVEALERAIASGETRDMSHGVPEGMPEARAQLTEALGELTEALEVPEGQLVLGGFSQGAMLALDTALHSNQALAGLVLMSGTLLCEEDWKARMPARRGLPVLQSHGQDDPLLPFALAQRLRERLGEAGLQVTWSPFRGAHEIPPPVLAALERFLHEALASSEP